MTQVTQAFSTSERHLTVRRERELFCLAPRNQGKIKIGMSAEHNWKAVIIKYTKI